MRDAIVQTASRLYRAEGLEGVSMRRVAGQLGVVPTAIYRHFRNKAHLIDEIVQEGRREFAFLLHQALDAPTPRSRFDAAVDAYLQFVVQRPDYYAALFIAPRSRLDTPLPDAFRTRRPPTFQFLVDRIEECMRHGVFRRDDAIEVALTCWSQIHGLSALYISGFFAGDPAALQKAVRRSFELIIDGIGQPPR